MIVIGLTGSIGMGKTTVAGMLERLGIPVHSADEDVRRISKAGGAAFPAIAAAFPDALDPKTGALDRAKLAGIVFRNYRAKQVLENILHPRVQDRQSRFLLKCRRMGVRTAALDIPLLFETGAERRVDLTICVSAPARVQRARVLVRPGMREETFTAILAGQMPDIEKRRRADIVIPTGLGYAQTWKTLKKTLSDAGI